MFCSFEVEQQADRVGVSAHNPGILAGVTAHTFQKECASQKRGNKACENRDHK